MRHLKIFYFILIYFIFLGDVERLKERVCVSIVEKRHRVPLPVSRPAVRSKSPYLTMGKRLIDIHFVKSRHMVEERKTKKKRRERSVPLQFQNSLG